MSKAKNETTCSRLFSRHYQLLCLYLFFSFSVKAQFTATIELRHVPAVHLADTIFIAGNFNNWVPDNNDYKFVKKNEGYRLQLKNIAAASYEFKFTRGAWNKVECNADGISIENRMVTISSDTALVFDVKGWQDDFGQSAKRHTASANVHVIDTAFEMPQLKRQRRIWIYLPPNYYSSKKRYPVLYIQDGQNLFDEYTSAYGEWGIDECLDSLISKGIAACMVVGIDNGGETRMNEYNPYQFIWKDSAGSKTFLSQGNEYLSFLVNTLKPFIDKHYKTLSSKENTMIGGSSMGGLFSYYAALKYPDVFGKAGVFSPAFWTADGINDATDSFASRLNSKFFFYMGAKEGERYLNDMITIQEKLALKSSSIIYSLIDNDASHNEAAWRKWFPEFYKWIVAEGFNVITAGEN